MAFLYFDINSDDHYYINKNMRKGNTNDKQKEKKIIKVSI